MATPTTGLSWGGNTVTWAFANTGSTAIGQVSDAITSPSQQAAVTSGINQWAQVSGVNLVQVSNPSQADVQVGYGNLSGLLGEDLWTYNPGNNQYTGGSVLLQDPNSTPLNGSALTYSGSAATLQQLATHEFGAALGLAEGSGSDPNSVMNHMQTPSNQTPDAADVSAIDSLYGGGSSGSSQGTAATPNGGSQASGSVQAVGGASNATISPDTLSLNLSEDAWMGDAQFITKVDGQQVGGPSSVTALHDQGQSQTFTYTGNWSGTPNVEIDFLNDAYGGSAGADRNLYVDQVSYNGASQMSQSHAMLTNGAFVLPTH